jgi:hypothetical protein
MTVIVSTPEPTSALVSTSSPPKLPLRAGGLELDGLRDQLQHLIQANSTQAQLAAEQGDLANAARFILAALDGERRMAATNPQVVQLIRPRA